MGVEGIKVLNVKVLMVDDNQEDINIVRDFLSTKGYEVLEARSGEQALLKVKQIKPDIVKPTLPNKHYKSTYGIKFALRYIILK